jgi:hypothetical protein
MSWWLCQHDVGRAHTSSGLRPDDHFTNLYDTKDLIEYEQGLNHNKKDDAGFARMSFKLRPDDNFYRSLEIFTIIQGIGFLLSSLPTMDLTGNIKEPYILSRNYIQKSCKDYYLGKNLVEELSFTHYGIGLISSIFINFQEIASFIVEKAKNDVEFLKKIST